MTKEEAFKFIDSLCAQVNVSRETHIRIAQALDLLKPEESHVPDNGRFTEVVR